MVLSSFKPYGLQLFCLFFFVRSVAAQTADMVVANMEMVVMAQAAFLENNYKGVQAVRLRCMMSAWMNECTWRERTDTM